jgi:hypothetical protein
MPKDLFRLQYIYLWTDIHKLFLIICSSYISDRISRSSYINLVIQWCILSYIFWPLLFLHISNALTITHTLSACLLDFLVGRTNPGTFCTVLTYGCSGNSWLWMPLLGTMSDSSSGVRSPSLSFRLSHSLFQFRQSSVHEMLSGALSSLCSTGWRLNLRIQPRLKIWVRPPGRSFAHKAGGTDDLSDDLNAATPLC